MQYIEKILNEGIGMANDVSRSFYTLALDALARSVKFRMPEDGMVIPGDTVKLNDSVMLKLPFKIIALEYPVTFNTAIEAEVVLLFEEENAINALLFLKYKARQTFSLLPIRAQYSLAGNNLNLMYGFPEGAIAKVSSIAKENNMSIAELVVETFGGASVAITQLLNVLDCSNVEVITKPLSPLKKSLNRKKQKYFEYYELVVTSKTKRTVYLTSENKHASPREHLRRGHIHTFLTKNGPIKKWLDSMVINAGVGTKLVKDYRIKSGVVSIQ